MPWFPQTTGHRKGQNRAGVSAGTKLFFFFFLNEATAGTPRHLCITFHANIWRSDLLMFNIKSNITQKLDPTLKQVISNSHAKYACFSIKSLNVHAVFKRDREILHTCCDYPSQELTSVFCFAFPLNISGRRRLKFPKQSYIRQKVMKKKIGRVFVKAHRRRFNISQSDLRKRRGVWPGHNFPSFGLNPVLFVSFFIEVITCRMPGTARVRLPVGNNNGTTFNYWPKGGNGRGTRWGRYISWHVFSAVLISSCFRAQGKVGPIYRVSSLALYEPTEIILLTNAACTIYSNVTHFGIIFPPRTVKEGDMAAFFHRT